MKKLRYILHLLLLTVMMAVGVMGCDSAAIDLNAPADTQQSESVQITASESESTEISGDTETELQDAQDIDEYGTYTSKDEVALYIHTYGRLPENFITKRDAQNLGWDNKAGNLQEAAPGMSIGGDKFGNYEGLLPEADGRKYYECDIDYDGGYRGSKRIIFSNDGLIYYTEDHYESFELLYE